MLCYFLAAVAKFVDLARNAKYSICARVALKRWAVELSALRTDQNLHTFPVYFFIHISF